jgi:hypothetical protein
MKKRHSDLRNAEKSLTRYIMDNSSRLSKLTNKSQLVSFIRGAKDQGYSLSDEKLREIEKRINRCYTFTQAHMVVYNSMLAGANLSVDTL